eukprot:1894168-Prorocentrum_lima.AAC.1
MRAARDLHGGCPLMFLGKVGEAFAWFRPCGLQAFCLPLVSLVRLACLASVSELLTLVGWRVHVGIP